jgi:monothiol glutaredoxin
MTTENPLFQKIKEIITNNPVVLFMKGTPQLPSCGFSHFVVQVLNKLSIDFQGVNVLEDEALRQGIKDFTNWPTIPQLYIRGEFIGGADIVRDLYQSEELFTILEQHGIPYQRPATS